MMLVYQFTEAYSLLEVDDDYDTNIKHASLRRLVFQSSILWNKLLYIGVEFKFP